MKNTGGVSTAECTQNITKKYVRFITPSFFLCLENTATVCFLFRQVGKNLQNINIER